MRPFQVYTKLVPKTEEGVTPTAETPPSKSVVHNVHSHETVTEAPVATMSEEPSITIEEMERRAIDTLTFMLQNRSSGL